MDGSSGDARLLSHAIEARRWRGLAVILSAVFLSVMDLFIVNVALPTIRADLGASFAEVELVIAGYGFTYAVALITGGRLGDRYGRRRLFMIGLGAFTAASLLCGLAPTPMALIAARLAQGLSSAVMIPQAYALIRVGFAEERERAKAFGLLGLVVGLASIAGQVVGGTVVELDLFHLGWRPIFLLNLPVGALAMILAPRLIDESRAESARRLDLVGAVLVTLGLSLLLYPLIEGREAGWPLWSFVVLALSLPALALFGVHQHWKSVRGASPLMETRLFRVPGFALGLALVLVLYSTVTSFYLSLSLLLQGGMGQSPLMTALIFIPGAAAFMGFSLLTGRVAALRGGRTLVPGTVLIVLGYAAIEATLAWAPGAYAGVELIPALTLLGIGQGMVMTQLLHVVLGRVIEADAGVAAGLLNTMQQVGGAAGVAVVGILFFGALEAGQATGAAPLAAYVGAFARGTGYNFLAAILVLGMLLTLLARQRA